MKKKIASILSVVLMFILLATTFVGCSLVEKDPAKYANQVITTIKIGDYTEDITREQVLNWWQNPVGLSGYYYMYYYGDTMEESLEKTVDDIVDYRIRVHEAKQAFGELTNNDLNNIKTSIYESIYSTLSDYEEEIKEEWGLDVVEEEEEDEDSDYINDKVDFNYVIDRDEDENIEEDNNGNPARVQEEEKIYSEPIFEYATDDLITKEAWKRFVISRQNYAEDEGTDCDTEEEAFDWEYDRLYEIYEDSLYVTKYQTNYTNSLAIDYQSAVDKYVEDYLAQYNEYAPIFTGEEADAQNSAALEAYISAMQSNNCGIYYHPTDLSVDFNRVVHILFKYTTDMIAEIEDLNMQLVNEEINQATYDYQYEILTSADREWVKYATDEEDQTIYKSPNFIYNEMNNMFIEIDSGTGDYNGLTDYQKIQKKAEIFLDYSYKYSEDSGFFSSDKDYTYFGYVVNVGENDNSAMTEEFTEAAQTLAADATYGASGGNMAEPVYHEDLSQNGYTGYHIVFNMGEVIDYFGYDSANDGEGNSTISWQDLASKETMIGSGVTLLDYIYDKINEDEDKLSNRVQELIDDTRSTAQITTYLKRLSDLYK